MDENRLALVLVLSGAWAGVALLVRRRVPTATFAALFALLWSAAAFVPDGVMWHRATLVHLLLARSSWLPRTRPARLVTAVSYLASATVWPWVLPWSATALAAAVLLAASVEDQTRRLGPRQKGTWRLATLLASAGFASPPLLSAAGLGRGWAFVVLLSYAALLLVIALLVVLAARPRTGAWATDLAVDLGTPPYEQLEHALTSAGSDAWDVRDEAAAALAAARQLQDRLARRQADLARTLAETQEARRRLASADEEERRTLRHETEAGAVILIRTAVARLDDELGDTTSPLLERARLTLVRAREHLSVAIDDLDALGQGFAAPALDRGLGAALADLASGCTVPVTLELPDESLLRELPDPVQSCLYYVAAEALANMEKHACASSAAVHLRTHATAVRLRVCDDGMGGASQGSSAGSGLAGLQHRAVELDGTLTVTTPPSGGTSVEIIIPTRTRPRAELTPGGMVT